jgi:tetratricopeptide (TPR) repeat protein
VAADQVALAAILDGQGRYLESEPLYIEAIGALLRAPGARAEDVAVEFHDLGTMYALQGHLERSRGMLEWAAELKRRALGPGHASLAVTLNNLAVVSRRQGDTAQAAALHAQAVEVLADTLRPDHPIAVTCRTNAARAEGCTP